MLARRGNWVAAMGVPLAGLVFLAAGCGQPTGRSRGARDHGVPRRSIADASVDHPARTLDLVSSDRIVAATKASRRCPSLLQKGQVDGQR